jgi:hypothetical protein
VAQLSQVRSLQYLSASLDMGWWLLYQQEKLRVIQRFNLSFPERLDEAEYSNYVIILKSAKSKLVLIFSKVSPEAAINKIILSP